MNILAVLMWIFFTKTYKIKEMSHNIVILVHLREEKLVKLKTKPLYF